MRELYAKYGELMVQKELIDGQIRQVAQQISQELNKPKKEDNDKKDGK